jgi:hypothetical protein
MQADAEAVQAHGIVGVQTQQTNHGWDSHVMEFFAIGAAVVRESPPASLPAPQLILSLNDQPAPPIENAPPPPRPRPTTGG